MANLSQKIASGASLTFLASVGTALTQAAILIILARILTPLDYGRFAVATTVSRLTVGLVSGVLERALLTGDSEKNIGSIVPFTVVFGTACVSISLGFFFLGGKEYTMFSALALVQIAALPTGFAITTRVALRRKLEIKPILFADIVGQAVGLGITTVILAYLGFGVLALSIGSLVQGGLQALLLLRYSIDGERTNFEIHDLFYVMRIATRVFPTALLELLFVQLPSVMIVYGAGIEALGLFTRVYSLVQIPIEMLMTSMTRVLVAGLISTRNDIARTKRALARLVTVGSLIVTPVIGGVAGSRVEFVNVVLGSRWAEGAAIVVPLVISTWFAVLAHLFAVFSEARAMYMHKAAAQLLAIIVQAAAMYVGGQYMGLEGTIAGITLGNASFFVVNMFLVASWLPLDIRDLGRWIGLSVLIGVATAAGAHFVAWAYFGKGLILIFSLQIFVCALITCVAVAMFARASALDVASALGVERLFRR